MSVEFKKVKGLDKIIDKSIDVGILETCIKITAEAKSLAPVNKQIGTGGRLRNSIMYKTNIKDGGLNDSGGERADRPLDIQPKQLEGYIGANLEYAIYQEYGTRRMRPQPFLRPAGLIVKSGNQADVIRKIEEETAKGVLQAGQTRETFR